MCGSLGKPETTKGKQQFAHALYNIPLPIMPGGGRRGSTNGGTMTQPWAHGSVSAKLYQMFVVEWLGRPSKLLPKP